MLHLSLPNLCVWVSSKHLNPFSGRHHAGLNSAVFLFKSSIGFLHDGWEGLVVFLMRSVDLPRDPKVRVFWAYSSFPLRHTEDIRSLSPETLISVPFKAVAAAESDPSGPGSAVVCAAPAVVMSCSSPHWNHLGFDFGNRMELPILSVFQIESASCVNCTPEWEIAFLNVFFHSVFQAVREQRKVESG